MTDTAATINREMIVTLVMIHRIACRALSDDERVGQRLLGNPLGDQRDIDHACRLFGA